MSYPEDTIVNLARRAARRPESVGVLSTGEQCAVALLCDNAEFLPNGYTFLDAVARLEGAWLAACLQAHKMPWRE